MGGKHAGLFEKRLGEKRSGSAAAGQDNVWAEKRPPEQRAPHVPLQRTGRDAQAGTKAACALAEGGRKKSGAFLKKGLAKSVREALRRETVRATDRQVV